MEYGLISERNETTKIILNQAETRSNLFCFVVSGADSLMASMFAHYDANGDNLLQAEELWRASEDDKMAQLSQACILADMLVFDDIDKDGTLSVAEFYLSLIHI